MGTRNYHWVFEADIQECFDELEHSAVMAQVRKRIADRRVREINSLHHFLSDLKLEILRNSDRFLG